MLVLFTLGAAVQLNDPDPVRWIAVYALAAAACLLSLLRRIHWALPALLCAVALTWAATLAPRVVGRVPFRDMFGAFEMRNVGVEESREMYGLLIIAAWMAVLALRARPAASVVRG
jgi:transmembrane protein TMEM220